LPACLASCCYIRCSLILLLAPPSSAGFPRLLMQIPAALPRPAPLLAQAPRCHLGCR
jgi:hypothetical protein